MRREKNKGEIKLSSRFCAIGASDKRGSGIVWRQSRYTRHSHQQGKACEQKCHEAAAQAPHTFVNKNKCAQKFARAKKPFVEREMACAQLIQQLSDDTSNKKKKHHLYAD